MASIEALAMAGADYLECAIPFDEYDDSDPPPHLLADDPKAMKVCKPSVITLSDRTWSGEETVEAKEKMANAEKRPICSKSPVSSSSEKFVRWFKSFLCLN